MDIIDIVRDHFESCYGLTPKQKQTNALGEYLDEKINSYYQTWKIAYSYYKNLYYGEQKLNIDENQCELLLYSLERLLDQYIEDYKNPENDINQFAKCVSQLHELHVLINKIRETNHE